MKLLVDEMYPPAAADALRAAGVEASPVAEAGLAGRSDPDVFEAAIAAQAAVLTENVGDFARIAAEHVAAGRHHPGVLIALSSRFSRRPAGRGALVAAVVEGMQQPLDDRTVFLER